MSALLGAVHGTERGWVWLYTAGMPAEGAERRREEIVAYTFDHLDWARREGQAPRSTFVQSLAGFVFGMPSDVSWRLSLGRRGLSWTSAGELAIAALTILGVIVGIPVAGFFAMQGRDWLLDDGGRQWASFGLFLGAVAGSLLFTGLGIFSRRPAAGATLVFTSGLCVIVSLWWSPVAPGLGAAVCVFSIAAARKLGLSSHG